MAGKSCVLWCGVIQSTVEANNGGSFFLSPYLVESSLRYASHSPFSQDCSKCGFNSTSLRKRAGFFLAYAGNPIFGSPLKLLPLKELFNQYLPVVISGFYVS